MKAHVSTIRDKTGRPTQVELLHSHTKRSIRFKVITKPYDPEPGEFPESVATDGLTEWGLHFEAGTIRTFALKLFELADSMEAEKFED